jgi:hypothetical protein
MYLRPRKSSRSMGEIGGAGLDLDLESVPHRSDISRGGSTWPMVAHAIKHPPIRAPFLRSTASLTSNQSSHRFIDIQDCFVPDPAPAGLPGVSITVLEAKLAAFNGGGNLTSLSEEQKRKIRAKPLRRALV